MCRLFVAFVLVIGLGVAAQSADSVSQTTATDYTASLFSQSPSSTVSHPDMADQIVVYSATWCGPCRQLSPVLRSLELEGYRVVHRDVDRDIDALEYQYDAVPTIYFVRNDEVIKTETGYRSKEEIKRTLMHDSHRKPH